MFDQATTQTLLTPRELATLTGAVTAVFVMTQGLRYSLGWKPQYVGLVLSLLVSLFAVSVSSDHSLSAWLVAVPNGFVIFASATGTAGMASAGVAKTKKRRAGSKNKKHKQATEEVSAKDSRKFWGAWF